MRKRKYQFPYQTKKVDEAAWQIQQTARRWANAKKDHQACLFPRT